MSAAVFVVLVAAYRSNGEQQQMINRVLCISRRIFSLLTPILLPAGPFCTVIPVSHDCSLYNFLGAVIPHLVGHNCSRFATLPSSVSLGIQPMAKTTPHHRQ
jgi:hypothetical protein